MSGIQWQFFGVSRKTVLSHLRLGGPRDQAIPRRRFGADTQVVKLDAMISPLRGWKNWVPARESARPSGLPFMTEELRTTSQNLSFVDKSAHTAVRALEVASQRHSLTGIGLRCDDTFLGAKAWRIPLS